MDYLKQAAEFVRQGVKNFQIPHLTDWVVTGTGGTSVSLGLNELIVLDIVAGTTELALRHRTANLSVTFEGKGASVGKGRVGAWCPSLGRATAVAN